MTGDISEITCEFEGRSFSLKVIFSSSGYVSEIIPEGFKPGSSADALAQDSCSLISALLQRFVSPEKLTELIQRKPNGYPMSLIGAILLHFTENQ